MLISLLTLCGCSENYPRVTIDPSAFGNLIRIDIAGAAKFNRFERFDDENAVKIVIYFDKEVKK